MSSVDIRDVLALLPELFPGVQPISLDRIRPYPDNPGPPVTEDQVQELTVPILEDGLVNPLKLRPDPAGPLVPGLSPHPDNPRLKMDGTPWRVEDFNWMILSGERRWRAFRKLHEEGWVWRGGSSVGHQASYRLVRLEGAGQAFIPAHILNPTEEEAVITTHTDNDVRDRGWFADHQSIEALIKVNPNLTQRQVAAKLKIEKKRVGWAISLLPLLNPQARALIGDNVPNSNKGIRGISEIAASELAGLGPGTGLKPGVKAAGAEAQKLWPYPAIPPETQDLVRRALAVAIDRKMTRAKVKALVQWVMQGNKPEEYPAKGLAPVQPTEGRPVQPKTATEKASVTAKAPTPSKTPEHTGAPGAGSPMEPAHPNHGPRLSTVPMERQRPNHAPRLVGSAQDGLFAPFVALAQGWWPEVKSFLLSQFKRALGHEVRRWIVTGLGALVVILLLSPHLYVSLYHLVAGYVRAFKSAAPPTQVAGSAQVDADSRLVQSFAKDFYGPDYTDLEGWQAFMENPIDPAYRDAFYKTFYPPSKVEAVRKLRLKESFQADQPPELLSSGKNGEVFLAQGRARIQSDLKSPGQVVAEGPVALEIHLTHFSGNPRGKIVEVRETMALAYDWTLPLAPTTAEKSKPGTQAAKAGQSRNGGGIQYVATVQVPVNGTTVTGIVDSKGVTVKGPKVFGVSLPSVNIPNPLAGF
jgi:hypothetical protein